MIKMSQWHQNQKIKKKKRNCWKRLIDNLINFKKLPDKIFFQSSLPRVGSTVFQNLMNQDPRFYASSTSGMLELIYAARHNYTESPEFKAQDAETMKKAFLGFCREGIHGYYNAITDKPYVIDKSR